MCVVSNVRYISADGVNAHAQAEARPGPACLLAVGEKHTEGEGDGAVPAACGSAAGALSGFIFFAVVVVLFGSEFGVGAGELIRVSIGSGSGGEGGREEFDAG